MTLQTLLASGAFHAYAYGYPHKTAYRAIGPYSLAELWHDEPRDALFLYLHLPFCEQRCGFCNLYTQARPPAGTEARYLDALARQAAVVSGALGEHRFAQVAVGGGTPTWLEPDALARLFRIVAELGAAGLPTSVEASPGTLTAEKVEVLAAAGVSRLSVGVQSVFSEEAAGVLRRQTRAEVERGLTCAAGRFATLNADLIYGLPGQTADSLRASIDTILDLGANELYLYPLYVRPQTGLGRKERGNADTRLDLYRVGRDHLRALGWAQPTMRQFRLGPAPTTRYRCQEDGMVGLGAGARSYTSSVHWASPFAVAQPAIRAGIEAWSAQSAAEFGSARHGIVLDGAEQRRRWAMLGLLDTGLHLAAWQARFGSALLDDLPELHEAAALGLVNAGAVWSLTEAGREASDVLGEWLQSDAVRARRAAWVAA